MKKRNIETFYNESANKRAYESFYQIYIKRVLDILSSLIMLPLLLLILIPISIAIKIEDNGPIFYKSSRIGINFKEFKMLKLRSMKVNAPDIRNEDGSTFNSEKDPRLTKIGKLIRETSIDELPQIINVLKGEMSIVGPRPGDVESKDTYSKDEIDKYLLRPGVTGYTQAYFRNNISVREKRLYDAWYSHNVSFNLDLKIFIKTISTVIKKDNIYTN